MEALYLITYYGRDIKDLNNIVSFGEFFTKVENPDADYVVEVLYPSWLEKCKERGGCDSNGNYLWIHIDMKVSRLV